MSIPILCEEVIYRYPGQSAGGTGRDLAAGLTSLPGVGPISGSIPAGQYLALIGPNGSGKSTLARLFNGLLVPTSGRVRIGELDTSVEADVWEIRRRVGLVFQNPDNQLVASTVGEDVAFGPENLGIPQPELGRRVAKALAQVGLEGWEDVQTHRLSGGQKQRVAIAGVLAMQPEVLVLDEPTAMLDPVGQEEVLSTVLALRRELGVTVVHITHNMNEVLLAERVWVLAEGHLVADLSPRQLFAQPELLAELHLDLPVVPELVQQLNASGWPQPLPSSLLFPEELVSALAPWCPGGGRS